LLGLASAVFGGILANGGLGGGAADAFSYGGGAPSGLTSGAGGGVLSSAGVGNMAAGEGGMLGEGLNSWTDLMPGASNSAIPSTFNAAKDSQAYWDSIGATGADGSAAASLFNTAPYVGTALPPGLGAASSAGLENAAAGGAGGLLNSAAGTAGSGLGGLLSGLGDNAKWLLPLLGGLGSYLDAKDKNGQTNGDPWATDYLRKHAGTPNPGLISSGPWGKY